MTIITLFPGDDDYTATTAGDIIRGVDGNDTLTASAGGNRLDGGDGDDVLNGAGGNDTLVGDGEQSGALNVLKGFGGDDYLISYSPYDQIDAGTGDDVVTSYAEVGGQLVDGGKGHDTLQIRSLNLTNSPINIVMGPVMSLTIGSTTGASYLNFEVLDVILGTGANTVVGGNGDDSILTAYKGYTNDVTFFQAGSIRAGGGDDTVAFNGLAAVGSGIQRMAGGTGLDRLSWTDGSAVITDLEINATKGTMTANGTKFATFGGFEVLEFRGFADIGGDLMFTGSDGRDTVRIGAVTFAVTLQGGDDIADIAAGSGSAYGGRGADFLRFGGYPNAANGVLHGGDDNDTLVGGAGKSDLFGDNGDDNLQSTNSHSNLFGGNGNDVLSLSFNSSTLGSGAPVIDGGAGRDSLTLTLHPATVALVLDLSAPTVSLPDGTTITGIEAFAFISGSGNDDLTASNGTGGAAVNLISGMNGNDTLRASANGATLDGGSDVDQLLGGRGADVLKGGTGNDVLLGQKGADTLIGNIGQDLLTGAAGADVFKLAEYFESGTSSTTRDRITDFSRGQGDKIDLGAVDAMLVSGSLPNDAFTFIGAGPFTHVAGQLRFEKVDLAGTANDYTLISGDLTGAGNAFFTIEVAGLIDFLDTDFVL